MDVRPDLLREGQASGVRPVLRPGTVVLRRDQRHLQLGVEPGRAVVLRDTPTVQTVLGRIDGLRSRTAVLAGCTDADDAARVLDSLIAVGMVADVDQVLATAASGELAHLLGRERSERAADRLRTRASATIGLNAGDDSGTDLLVAVGELLVGSGVGRLVATDDVAARVAQRMPAERWRHTLPSAGSPPDVTVVVGSPVTGPDTEDLVADGVAHLAVSVVDGIAVVGPFVRPGRTACVGCVDRTRAARDPAWPALVDQLQRSAGQQARNSVDLPRPRNRVLEGAAASWTARDVLAHLAGQPVLTYGTSLRLDDGLVNQVVNRWELHPACGCSLLA